MTVGSQFDSEIFTGVAVLVTIGLTILCSYLGRAVLVAFLMSLLVAVNIASIQITKIFGFPVSIGTPLYAVTFLVSNIISEKYGKSEAHRAVTQGFVAIAGFVVISYLASAIPGNDSNIATKVREVLLRSIRILAASFTTYIVAQHMNVYIYNFARRTFGEERILLRNNISNIIAEILDSSIFFSLAFIGTAEKWWALAFSGFLLKSIIGFFDGPLVKVARKLGTREYI